MPRKFSEQGIKISCGAIAEAEKNLGENCIKGLFVDARKDDTLVLQ